MREQSRWIALYAGDYKDFVPSWIGDRQSVVENPRRWRAYSSQGFAVMHKRPWFQFTGMNGDDATLRCPANQIVRLQGPGKANNDYAITNAAYIMPEYLDPSLSKAAWASRLGGRVQQLASVMWPSAKVEVFEQSVWHGWKGVYAEGADIGSLFYYESVSPGSLAFFDGHVESRRPRAQPWVNRYPIWAYGPFDMTDWGLRGRDY